MTKKQNNCPFKDINNKCTHKTREKCKKRHCGYKSPLKCRFYVEWLDLVDCTQIEESLNTELPAAIKQHIKSTSVKNKIFFRYCKKCGEKFQPTGKKQKVCEKCKPFYERRRKKDIIFSKLKGGFAK